MRILLIDIDSCRPDHLGCYGYHRPTSPNIDAIAARGRVFEQCHTSDAPCLPSRTAFYSGRFGIRTGVVGHGATAAQPKVEGNTRNFRDYFTTHGLANHLRRAGFHTAMISPFANRHSAHWFYAGFAEMHDTGLGGNESAEDVWPVTENWFKANAARDNWFLHLNFWDPHTPYRVPADYGNPFADHPLPKWLDDDDLIARHNKKTGPHSSLDYSMYHDEPPPQYPRQPGKVTDHASMRQAIDGYDTGIRYVDDHIGRILGLLEEAGVRDDTAIIITADHGENFGELGIYGEHGTADTGTCRIPLIISWPGGATGRDAALRYHLDLAPTLLELLGRPSEPKWDGRSFAPSITLGDENNGREELILSQCCHVCQRSVRFDRWLYIRTYHDGFHLFPQEMLFDLVEDPHEQDNLAEKHPEVCREAAWRLLRWHDERMQAVAAEASDAVDPLWTVIREGGPFHARTINPGQPGGPEGLLRYIERLEATGRGDGAAELRRRYHRFLPGESAAT